jgi:hypothetical protein
METILDPVLVPSVPAVPTRARWGGRVLTAVPVLFLVFDGTIKLAGHPAVAEASERLGLPPDLSPALGVLLLACLALYLVPRTAALGAVLLTGYLGGAVLAHVRVSDPLFSHALFPVYIGALLWSGLFLRDDRVRRLFAAR